MNIREKCVGALSLLAAACAAQPVPSGNTVVISGSVNAQFESIRADGATNPAASIPSRTRVNQNGSELRFTATREFDGGLQGYATIGSEIQSFSGANGNNTNTFGFRNTGVGVRGSFGEVALGRWDSHYHWSSLVVDRAFLTGGLALDSKSLLSWINSSGATNMNFLGNRFSNTVRYNTPSYGGATGHLIYSRNDGAAAAFAGRTKQKDSSVNLAATYSNGPLSAFGSYFTREGANVPMPYASPLTPSLAEQKAIRLGGAYQIAGGWRVGLIFDRSETQQSPNLATTLTAERTAWAIPVVYTTGKHQFSLTYARAGDTSGTLFPAIVAVGTNSGTGASMMGLGYQYAFDRNANFQLAYSRLTNQRNAGYDFNLNGGAGVMNTAAPGASALGADPRTLQVGLRFAF